MRKLINTTPKTGIAFFGRYITVDDKPILYMTEKQVEKILKTKK